MGTALDRLAIQELNARYCWAVDSGDGEAFAQLFTEDGAFRSAGMGLEIRGAEALRGFPVVARFGQRGLQHWTTNVVVDFDGEDRARSRSYVFAIFSTGEPQIGESGAVIERLGQYIDEVHRVGPEQWRLHERVFHPILASVPVA